MSSKAERKRRKKAASISLPGGETVPQRIDGPGRPRGVAEDARKTATDARMRRSGIKDPDVARQPICGTDVGLCIRALASGDEFAAIASTWAAISAAHRNYRMLYIGQTGDPKGAAIAMIPDRLETNQALTIDARTPEDRVRAAKASWAEWESKIVALPAPPLRWAIEGVLSGFMGEGDLWREAEPTTTGKTVVLALRMLCGLHNPAREW